jgi:hypothetical protein
LRVNVLTVLLDIEGIPLRDAAIKDTEGKVLRPERDFTLRKACTEALQTNGLAGDTLDGEERYRRYQLAIRIMSEDSPDLSAEEVAKLKRLIGLAFGAIVVGRAYEILDPPTRPV